MASPDLVMEAGVSRVAVEGLSARLGEGEQERAARLAALDAYERLPLPAWRLSRTQRRNLTTVDFSRIVPFAAQTPAGDVADTGAATRIVNLDGEAISLRLAPEIAATGTYVAPFETALRERPELVRPHFGRIVDPETNRLTALNAALHRGGLFVHVPRGVELREAIELHTIVEHASAFPRLLIVAEEHASVQVLERIESRPATGEGVRVVCSVTEIVANAGARVTYAALQQLGEDVPEIAMRRASVGRDANVEFAPITLGGDIVKSVYEANLEGEGATGGAHGLFFPAGREAFDLSARITHAAPHTTSDALLLGAANGAGQAAFDGMIAILESGAGSLSNLRSLSLLLAPKAHIDSVPGMEIANNDVKAYHGATIGEIDPETLFFCQSRGIDPDEARRMIVAGFFSTVVDAIPSTQARIWVQQRIEAKL
ncbi:SufD family Fe-S cluster assembly protein [bacterium]|nr:MAG: SufD family Fe-S cluster assembly protein [bacterium]